MSTPYFDPMRPGQSIECEIRPSSYLPSAVGQVVVGTDHVSGRPIKGTVVRLVAAGCYVDTGEMAYRKPILRYSEDARQFVHFSELRGMTRRAYITGHADTFFSVPARVSVGGRKIAGFISAETVQGYSTATDDDPMIYIFRPYLYGANLNHPAYIGQ